MGKRVGVKGTGQTQGQGKRYMGIPEGTSTVVFARVGIDTIGGMFLHLFFRIFILPDKWLPGPVNGNTYSQVQVLSKIPLSQHRDSKMECEKPC